MDTLTHPTRSRTVGEVNEQRLRFSRLKAAAAAAGSPWALPADDPKGFAEMVAEPYRKCSPSCGCGRGRSLITYVTDEAIGRWSLQAGWSLFLQPDISEIEILDAIGYWLTEGNGGTHTWGTIRHREARHKLIQEHLGDEVAQSYWAAVLPA